MRNMRVSSVSSRPCESRYPGLGDRGVQWAALGVSLSLDVCKQLQNNHLPGISRTDFIHQ